MKKFLLFFTCAYAFAASSESIVNEIAGRVNSHYKGCKIAQNGEAVVKIHIDTSGNFSYQIAQMSENDSFNAELKSCLDALKGEKFPKKANKRETILKLKLENKTTEI